MCEREINLQRSESGKLLDNQRRDSRAKYSLSLSFVFHLEYRLKKILTLHSESFNVCGLNRPLFAFRLIETARLLRNVRNVFRRPNTSSEAARQTELELSRNCQLDFHLGFFRDSFGILSGFFWNFEFFWNCTGLLKIPYDSQIFQIVQSPLNIWDYQRLSGILIHSVRMFEIPTNCRVFCKRILHSIFDFFF